MRSLILADVHANLEALNAVLADANDRAGSTKSGALGIPLATAPTPTPAWSCSAGITW